MKWCIIINGAPFLTEFLGKLSSTFLEQGDECVLVYTSKLAEYGEARYFSSKAHSFSEVDWFLAHYDASRKDYGDLTWRELYPDVDRAGDWPWGYEESARHLAQNYQFFDEFLRREKPDAILFEPPSGSAAQPASFLAATYGIPYLGLIDSRIAGHLDVFDSGFDNVLYRQTFEALKKESISAEEKEFARHFIQEFLSHKRLPSYYGVGKIRFGPLEYVAHYIERVREVGGPLWRYFRERTKFKGVDFESESRLAVAFGAPFALARRQARIATQKSLYEAGDLQDEYYLFPLHLQPESSTSVQAMQYADQVSTIRNIAFSITFPSMLYVKEHPYAVGTKPDSFYREIKSIPNVKLIAPQENIQELIRNSQGVITLAGTAGMEAVLAGKPAYVLGNVFYTYHPFCRTPKNIDELRELILADRRNKIPQENLEEHNLKFVVSYLRNTIPGITTEAMAENDTNDYGQIAHELRRMAQSRRQRA
ncbi:MAG: hypothetical protein Q7S63_02165 [bacterium]|nr:hypothetical protein [bacterium]